MGSLLDSTAARGKAKFAVALLLWALPVQAEAQFFNLNPIRPPADIPGAAPDATQSLAPPTATPAPPPKASLLKPPPPAATPAPHPGPAGAPSGQAALAVAARFGRDLPA